LKQYAVASAVLAVASQAPISTAALLMGYERMVRGVERLAINRRNAYYAPYNQDISVEDQNNNPTVAEIFTELEFPHPAIHPDHWAEYYKLNSGNTRLLAVNQFARRDASNKHVMNHAYFIIGAILSGRVLTKEDEAYQAYLRKIGMNNKEFKQMIKSDLISRRVKRALINENESIETSY
jgi:hypothetical protein